MPVLIGGMEFDMAEEKEIILTSIGMNALKSGLEYLKTTIINEFITIHAINGINGRVILYFLKSNINVNITNRMKTNSNKPTLGIGDL